MMKHFENPNLEIDIFGVVDVLSTSTTTEYQGDGEITTPEDDFDEPA